MSKKTLVLGASNNPGRYSFMAIHRLLENGYEVVPIGIKKGEVAGLPIINEKKPLENVDTVTLYLGPGRQDEYYDYILQLKPRRVIFNPGTYNQELIDKLTAANVEVEVACTLVMLASGAY
jgi:predicted CoA-binding protein